MVQVVSPFGKEKIPLKIQEQALKMNTPLTSTIFVVL